LSLVLLVSWLAHAHPVGAERTSQQVRLTLTDDQVVLDYGVWIPTRQLAQIPADERLAELSRGFSLTANEEPLVLEPQEMSTPPVAAQGHLALFQLGLRAVLPNSDENLELVLFNPNEPESLSAFQSEIFLGREWQTLESSLLRMENETLVENLHGQWRMEEESREIRLKVRRLPTWQTAWKDKRFVPVAKALPPPRRAWILPGSLAVLVAISLLVERRQQIKPTP